MTARVNPETIVALEPVGLPHHEAVREAIRTFAVLCAWAHPYQFEDLSGIDAPQAPPICECSIVRFPVTRGFQLVEADELGTVPAMVCLVTGDDAETPIGLVAWCCDQPGEIYRYPDDLPCLGLDQLGNPASYFAGNALPVHRTVPAWLQAGCRGVVILDHDVFWEELRALPYRDQGYRLLVEDVPHGRELRDDKLNPLPPSIHLRVRPQGASWA
jgi:hypothetical protein